ncbi:MAG TPA: VOC family protein [Ktedonobacteraceae bacterium]|nr:VOC family protein [Ktedonobacteraceae bacterium]
MWHQTAETQKTGTTHVIPLTLEVNGKPYAVEVNPQEIFHEALEHALPTGLLVGHRIRISTPQGDEVFPDMFIGESVTHFQTETFCVEAMPLSEATAQAGQQTWTNFGFDHLAVTFADRADAVAFFSEVLGMTIVRDDRHQTVLTTGNVALFCFDAEKAPLSDGLPSRWHHIGFVVDNLDAAYHHLAHHAQLRRERADNAGNGSGSIASDFTLLERNERWSLYCHYRNGDTSLMIQLSEIKPENRGFANPRHFSDHMYDYLSGRYGVRFPEEPEKLMGDDARDKES